MKTARVIFVAAGLIFASVAAGPDASPKDSPAHLGAAHPQAAADECGRLLVVGRKLFVARCSRCHGERGEKPLSTGLPLNRRKLTPEHLARSVNGRLQDSTEEQRRAVQLLRRQFAQPGVAGAKIQLRDCFASRSFNRTTAGPGVVINLRLESSIGKSRDQNRAAVAGRLPFECQFRIALNRGPAHPHRANWKRGSYREDKSRVGIPRAASRMTAVLVGLFLSAGLRADEPLQAEIDFRSVYSLPVVELVT